MSNKPTEFSHHALERGLQIGLSEDLLRLTFAQAKRLSLDKLLKQGYQIKKHIRHYQNGSTHFVVSNLYEKRVVITVWDDIVLRQEGYKLQR